MNYDEFSTAFFAELFRHHKAVDQLVKEFLKPEVSPLGRVSVEEIRAVMKEVEVTVGRGAARLQAARKLRDAATEAKPTPTKRPKTRGRPPLKGGRRRPSSPAAS